ncbi:unnamed protein product [Nesidiocoris tenuis]|uniref:Uncharacterized protein n=1 Tax=Nesidiocoris tenuis TaxID=355587 RepID=A0A6H5H7S6_9HEMI|nr:unnamed protein product [Nesidiocoris tenuis]
MYLQLHWSEGPIKFIPNTIAEKGILVTVGNQRSITAGAPSRQSTKHPACEDPREHSRTPPTLQQLDCNYNTNSHHYRHQFYYHRDTSTFHMQHNVPAALNNYLLKWSSPSFTSSSPKQESATPQNKIWQRRKTRFGNAAPGPPTFLSRAANAAPMVRQRRPQCPPSPPAIAR